MNAPTRYQFLIDGEVSDRVKAAFPDLSVASAAGEFTSLYGPVADHTAMRSIMARLDSLGLTVAELQKTGLIRAARPSDRLRARAMVPTESIRSGPAASSCSVPRLCLYPK